MRIIFMGTPEFALPSLQILLDNKYDVVAVVTTPSRPQGRGKKVASSPIKKFAAERNLPLLQPESLKNPDFISAVKNLQPDLIVVVAFRILPKEVFTIPRLGSFNLHASLLPKYRGAAPINWAIINGEQETGVTTFFLQEKVDTGSVILQARVKIAPNETAGELHDKLSEVGAEIVLQTVRLIELGKAQPRTQDEAFASPAPKIFKENCKIDWSKSASQVHNFIRGLSPHPCAWTTHQDKMIRIYKAEAPLDFIGADKTGSGEIVEVRKDQIFVQTGNGIVSVLELQQEGRKRMETAEFLRGYNLKIGDKLG
ncbi:MAG: methionyl-tRNA formyltransferase [Ignavibacteriales bacterium]|nr:methionyl-tRNA formyltransferase [Ignavibacteriales bacterium]